MCMNESTSWKSVLPLINLLEISLQKESVLWIILRVAFQYSVRGGVAFPLSMFDIAVQSVGGMVSVGLHVLLWAQVLGPSGVDVTNM